MISSTVLITEPFYYPLGNTPPVSLAQDLPPEQDADILLLGCGDVRNILFSCFVDNARRMDVTCCDIEPGIQARNALLYSLLIDDKLNLNFDRIWNIYYHWSLDDDSVELLETQIEKLLQHSKSIDEWHNSVYGSTIRFCDETSLSRVRDYWMHFSSKSLTPSEEDHRVGKLKAARERALAYRNERTKGNDLISTVRSTLPVVNTDCCSDFSEVNNHWWAKGTVPMSAELSQKMVHLNPTFFYSQTEVLTLHYETSPLLGFPLSTAQAPISEGSAFHLPKRGLSSIDHLVECAKRHFAVWALSFRIAAANKLIIRIFTGDALAFCFALCSHKRSIAAGKKDNWFHTNFNCSIINLHVDQDSKIKPAPVNFDVIDTSNIADTLGALNLMSLGSVLLKHHASSSLYTETFLLYHSSIMGRFSNMLCADVRTMPLLLGFVLPDFYTNATNSVEEDYFLGTLKKRSDELVTNKRSRLRWKRSAGFHDANNSVFGQIEVEAKALAKFLVAVHNEMFKYDDITWWSSFKERGSTFWREVYLSGTFARYNRSSFAFLLTALKSNVISDWDLCVECIYREIFSFHPLESLMTNSAQDLILNMHLFGVDNGRFIKPSSRDVKDAVLAPILPLNEGLPDQLCVTIRVSRIDLNKTILKKTLKELGCRAFVVNFEGSEPGHVHWVNFFSAVQIMFGKWCKAGEENNSYPFIEEDSSQLSGSSDMYVSVLVPTCMLLRSKSKVPLVKVGLLLHSGNQPALGEELGPTLCFASKMTSKDVFITRYMPGTSSLPNFAFLTTSNSKESKANSNVTTLRLSDDGLKVKSLTRRVFVQNDSIAKAKLALRTREMKIHFKSPFLAVVNIAKSLNIEFKFPVPVSMSRFRVKIASKSSYIEVETPLLNAEEAAAANFMFPLFVAKVPSGSKIPIPWSAMRINLDAMPPLDVSNKESIAWMYWFSGILPHPEKQLRESDATSNVRNSLKKLLVSLFMHFVGLYDVKVSIFGLSTKNLGIQTLIFASNLRLDLANLSVVLDAAVIPLSYEMLGTEEMTKFLSQLSRSGLLCILSDEQNVSWKVLLPAMVERCRASNTWKHTPRCEYLEVGEIPLPEVGKSSICSCGIGKCFPPNYLKESKNKFSELDTILNLHATRAAIGPIFAVPYVEKTFDFFDEFHQSMTKEKEKCENCGKSEKEISPGGSTEETLRKCSKCRAVKYCSKECQKTDWSKHKPVCKAN